MSFVPADRRGAGGLLTMTVAENVVVGLSVEILRRRIPPAPPDQAGGARPGRASATPGSRRLGRSSARCRAATSRRSFSVAVSSQIRACSILHEPTRGIDVGAKAEIYGILRGIAAEGVAIVLITSEIAELIMNAERVLVMRNGLISGDLAAGDINEEAILMRTMAA